MWPLGVGPGARVDSQLAYLGRSQELVLFGGIGDLGCMSDFWRLDTTSLIWSILPPSGSEPGPREDATLTVLGPSDSLWLLFGNCSGSVPYLDYFRVDIADSTWTRFLDAGTHARSGHVTAPDARREELLLYGGLQQSGAAPTGDHQAVGTPPQTNATSPGLWTLDPSTGFWTQLDPRVNNRSWAVGDYDALSDAFLFYGGRSTGGGATDTISNELRIYNRSRPGWQDQLVGDHADRRMNAIGHYCPCSGELLVFGGMDTTAIGLGGEGVHGDGFVIPIERKAEIIWETRDSLGTRYLAGELVTGLNNVALDSLALWDCQLGVKIEDRLMRTLDMDGRVKVRTDSLSFALKEAIRREALIISGEVGFPKERFLARLTQKRAPMHGASLIFRPSPTTGSATIVFDLAEPADEVRISIHSIAGRQVSRLTRSNLCAGVQSILWNRTDAAGNRVPRGTYFVRVDSASAHIVGKLVLL